ncbi:alpha-amylase [Fischerella thermalis CCMEE 5201]|jgi:alpha-amylase|nr:alpha-amylase [Fischerella thermalis CCMEE 5201]
MSIENGVMIQFFQWYTPSDGTLWKELQNEASKLSSAGITAVWLPPAYKGSAGVDDVGYGVYDLFDLGEFHQKNTIRTKYGTKKELIDAIQAVQNTRMEVYGDVVLNHKDGGDEIETFWAQEVDWNDRNKILSDWYEIAGYTKFTFPGRGDKYSSMKWYWWCFDSLSYNAITGNTNKLYRLKEKGFETEVSYERSNYDYLLGNDIDTREPFVIDELRYWGRWFVDETNVNGFRIDAVKHVRSSFFKDWINHLRVHFSGRNLFSFAEYWSWRDTEPLHNYIVQTEGVMSLFDVPLHMKFHDASRNGSSFDMRTMLDRTLVKEQPALAVTFVENHDTQPCQSLESPVEPWFKPLAYAFILLRREGYPCIFYADYYGAKYSNCRGGYDVILYSHRFLIDKFLWTRRAYGYGEQHNYFDHPNTIGWTRLGNREHPGAMAVVMTNGADGNKWMNMFRPNKAFYDITEHIPGKIYTNADGWGNFPCKGGSVSVWLQE